MESKDYNGWTNYETWLVALWIDNDPGTYERRREMATEAYEANECDRDAASRDLAEELKVWVEEELAPTPEPGLLSDLVGAALGEVNWDEIASNYIEEVN